MFRLFLWAILLGAAAFTRADPDLWGHVLFGLDIIRDLAIPVHDPYSFTSDRQWINHEWAAEVFTGSAFRLAGNAGLVLLKFTVVCGFLLLLLRALRIDGVHEPRVRDYLAGIAIITTVQQAHHLRPQIFSLLFFAALLTCLLNARRGNRRWLAALPFLFAAWANFHGGWIVGGGVLVLWTAGVAVTRPIEAAWHAAAGAASLGATLANPHGWGLWQFLWETVGFGRVDITDWQPIYALDPSIWGLWILTVVVAGIGLVRSIRMGVDPAGLLVVGALAVASFRVNRLLGFFALATLFLLGSAIAGAFRERRRAARQPPLAPTSVTIVALAFIGLAAAFAAWKLSCVHVDPRVTPPPGAVQFLKTQPGGRLLVWFDWGEYAIWHLAPQFKVSTDGRRETVYSASLHDRHLRFFLDQPGGSTLPDELGANYVWIPLQLPAARRITSTDWKQVYADGQSVIFARAAEASTATTPSESSNHPRCFPGP